MGSLNKVMLIGRLGKDPEVRYFDSGAVKVSFPLATSDSYNDRDGNKVENTEWHNIVVWRKGLTTVAEKYCQKGREVYIEGRIKTRSWDDQNGQKKYMTEIEAQAIQLLGSRNDAQQGGGNMGGGYQQQQQSQQNKPATAQENNNPFNNNLPEEDDLPF